VLRLPPKDAAPERDRLVQLLLLRARLEAAAEGLGRRRLPMRMS
jgi:hypothetical protein